MTTRVSGQFDLGLSSGNYVPGSGPILDVRAGGEVLLHGGSSVRTYDSARNRLGDAVSGEVKVPATLTELSNGNFVSIYGQTLDYSIGSPLVTGVKVYRHDDKLAQIGDPIEVVDHKVPLNGLLSYSVTAFEGGFVAQWIDDRVYDGKMMAQVFGNNGKAKSGIFELDSSYRDSIVPATVTALKNGNLQFNWYDGGTSFDTLVGAKEQVFRPAGTATGPAEIVDAYRPDAIQLGRTSWVDLEIGAYDAANPTDPAINALLLGFRDGPTDGLSNTIIVSDDFDRYGPGGKIIADPDQIGRYMFGYDLAWSDDAGILMAVWAGHDGTGIGSGAYGAPNSDIFFGLFTRSGTEIIANVRLNNQSIGVQEAPQIADLGKGKTLVAWSDAYTGKMMATEFALPQTLIEGTKARNTLNGGGQRDAIIGKGGNDKLNGGANNDILNGGDGDDQLTGGKGNDTIVGGAGDDSASGSSGGDLLDGGKGDDTLSGDKGDDALSGGVGKDRLIGGTGKDTLDGGDGADVIGGGGGNDLADGGTGNDRMTMGGNNDTATGGDGNDAIDGNAGNDSLSGDAGRDTLKGGSGADTLRGGTEADVLRGGAGFDTLSGDDGNDRLYGDAGLDNLSGGDGNDLLDGGRDPDLLFGGFGNDTLRGGAGDDRLTAYSGNEVLTGGPGADTFVFSVVYVSGRPESGGRDRITDWESGVDRIEILGQGLVVGDSLKLRDGDKGLLLTWDNGQIVIQGETVASFDTGDLFL